MNPFYSFEIYLWFNIPEDTWLKLTHIGSDHHSQKRQRTDDGSGTNSQCQHQRQVQQIYSYFQPVLETIIRLPPRPHGSIPPYTTPRQSEISQTSQQTHADDFSTMTQGTRGVSIMGGQNEQAYFRSRNTNGRNISSMHTHIMVGRVKVVIDPDHNTTRYNESDTNADTCCLGQNFIPITYTNRSEGVYPYGEAYEIIEMCLLFVGIHLTITQMGILTS